MIHCEVERQQQCFELSLDIDWKCACAVGNGRVEIKGSLRANEFSSEELDELELKCICDAPTAAETAMFSDAASFKSLVKDLQSAVKTEGVQEVKRILTKEFVATMLEQANTFTGGEQPFAYNQEN